MGPPGLWRIVIKPVRCTVIYGPSIGHAIARPIEPLTLFGRWIRMIKERKSVEERKRKDEFRWNC